MYHCRAVRALSDSDCSWPRPTGVPQDALSFPTGNPLPGGENALWNHILTERGFISKESRNLLPLSVSFADSSPVGGALRSNSQIAVIASGNYTIIYEPWNGAVSGGSIQHITDEDSIAGSGIADHDMGDGADGVAVLDDGEPDRRDFHWGLYFGGKQP